MLLQLLTKIPEKQESKKILNQTDTDTQMLTLPLIFILHII